MSDESSVRQQVVDLMGDKPELVELKPVLLLLANAQDRADAERRADRVAQRAEYVRLQGVQVTILMMILGLVGLLVKAL